MSYFLWMKENLLWTYAANSYTHNWLSCGISFFSHEESFDEFFPRFFFRLGMNICRSQFEMKSHLFSNNTILFYLCFRYVLRGNWLLHTKMSNDSNFVRKSVSNWNEKKFYIEAQLQFVFSFKNFHFSSFLSI